jgi:uncharacterized protein YhjY with autotransporter beta-barrel domain
MNYDNGVPNSTTALNVPISGTLNVTTAGQAMQILTVENSTFNLSAPGNTLIIEGETPFAGGTNSSIALGSTVNFSAGTLSIQDGILEVGNSTGSGTLNVTGGTIDYDNRTTPDSTRLSVGNGGTGAVNQSGNSVVTAGQQLIIGSSNGTGSYNLAGNSTLTIGTSGKLADNVVEIGGNFNAGDNSSGSLVIGGTSTFTVGADGRLLVGSILLPVGSMTPNAGVLGASGSVTQNDSSVVNLGGTSAVFGAYQGSSTNITSAVYNLNGGSLNISNQETLFGAAGDAVGTLNQAGGALIAGGSTALIFGTSSDGNATGSGAGIYNLSGGTASIAGELVLGEAAGSTGSVVQTGGTMTAQGGSFVIIGDTGAGSYSISGPNTVTAAFNGGLFIGGEMAVGGAVGTGTFTQSGGAVSTTSLNIGGAAGTGTGVYNYSGGTLAVTGGVAVGATGTFNQTGGALTFNSAGSAVTVNAGGSYNLNGGTLSTGGNFLTGGGNFNFGGGTLLTQSAFNDTLAGTISGNSTIDTTLGGATLSNVLNGNGNLNIIGGNTVTLTGTGNNAADSFGATISGGSTLVANSVNSLSSTGTFSVGTGSFLRVNSTAGATDNFAGSIAGAGNFITGANDAAANKLVLSGTTALTSASTTTIGAGGFGSLEVDNGTISNVNGTNADAADTFDVGSGTGNGTVILTGASILPTVTVNAGSTLLAGNATAGAYAITGNVFNNGTLGTLGTSTAPATLLINGNLTSTNTLLIHTNGLTVDTFGSAAQPLTTANLTGKVNVQGIGTITDVPIVYTSGGIIPDPTTLTTSAPTALFSSTVTVVGNNLVLSTTQVPVGSFAQTPNEAAVASSLDHVISGGVPFPTGFVPLLTGLNQLTAGQLPGALEQLTPESLQYARNIAYENATYLALRMNNVDADLRNGYSGLDANAISVVSPGFESGMGRSLGSMLAYNDPGFHTSAPNGVNYYPGESGRGSPSPSGSDSSAPSTFDSSNQVISDSPNPYLANVHPGGPETPAMSEFIGGDVVLADLNQDQSVSNAPSSKANYTAGDVTAGVSFRITNHFAAGVLFDYDHTDADTDSNGSKTRINTYSPGLYATYFDRGFYANGLFSFGYNTYSNTRNTGFGTASSSPNGQQYIGDLDFGYDFHPDKSWIVGPTLGVTYTHLDIDSFTETGAPGADLAVQSQSTDSLRSRLGGHLIYQTNTGDVLLQPNFTAMWQHEFLADGSGITSSFNDFSSNSFTIQTAAPSRDSALIGVGLTATLNNSMALYLNYLADVGAENYFSQSVIGGFKARF